MSGLKLASLIESFVQILRPGGQIDNQTTAFGFLAVMGGAIRAFPASLLKPGGACLLRPTSPEALEEAIDWVCSWRAGGGSCLEQALSVALTGREASEVVVLADQCPTRGMSVARSLTTGEGLCKIRHHVPVHTVAFECDQAGRRFLSQVVIESVDFLVTFNCIRGGF
jgi:hypothetical protein